MADRKNNNVVEDLKSLSQLGGDGALRDSHSYPGHYIRTKESLTVVRDFYDSFDIEYNVDNLPTQVCYYAGTAPHLTTIACKSDVLFSLQSTYFFMYAAQANTKFYVWYNVDGLGVDPAISGSIGIEVPIMSNDDKTIVANATQLILNLSAYKTYFNVTRVGSILTITNLNFGPISDTIDNNTTFVFGNVQGERELTQKINLTYVGRNPVYNGQELIEYSYNVYTGRFEKNPEISATVDLDLASTFAVTNISAPTAGIETAVAIPDGTKRFSIKAKQGNTKMEISNTSGGSKFTVGYGTSYTVNEVKTVGVTVYVTLSRDTRTLELLTWS